MAEWMVREIFSDMESMRGAVEHAIAGVLERTPLEEDAYFDLKVILRELSCNALEHGRSPVEISISLCCDGRHLHALICDAGEGFDPCQIAKELNVKQERGRGIAIVNNLAEGLAYNTAANKVLVRLKI